MQTGMAESTSEWKRHFNQWWNHDGLVFWVTAPRETPQDPGRQPPPVPADLEARWLSPMYRAQHSDYTISRKYYGGDAFPYAYTCVGPGDLAPMLGSGWHFAESTVWYTPSIADPDAHPPLTVNWESHAYRALMAMVDACAAVSAGRYPVGIPDLIENVDILAALRDPQTLLVDMIERPEWVEERIKDINRAWFQVFDAFYDRTKAADGSSVFAAFSVWGPGKVAKVQCDAAAMFSPAMFKRFVVPALSEQCEWLDQSLFHLDGEQCRCQLDNLFAIEALDAIEWTPVGLARGESGGAPCWYDLFRRILAAGKSVQAVNVHEADVLPLLDAVGGKGMFIMTSASSETKARELEERVRAYR
ncbi:MAG: hypothetical protein K8T26_16565 [Lentisphaerae bacterium]|nr:hypothetical protein [Lentisphaerota bacterium]